MSEGEDLRPFEYVPPRRREGRRDGFECPECGHPLPVDSWTECDRCGAHLRLRVEVIAPGVDTE